VLRVNWSRVFLRKKVAVHRTIPAGVRVRVGCPRLITFTARGRSAARARVGSGLYSALNRAALSVGAQA